jgi:hypothetical protein
MSDGCKSGLRFKKGDMDCANGFLVSEVEKLVPRTIIARLDEHATKRFGDILSI